MANKGNPFDRGRNNRMVRGGVDQQQRPSDPLAADKQAEQREAAITEQISRLYSKPDGLTSDTISVNLIEPNPNQPRKNFEGLERLVESIRENGFISQILVRPSPVHFGKFEIIYGERRWRAAREAGLKEIPCLIGEMAEEKVPIAALIENINRQDLDPDEEGKAYQILLEQRDERGRYRYTQDSLARQLGINRSRIIDALKLANAPQDVRDAYTRGDINKRLAGNLAKVSDPQNRATIVTALTGRVIKPNQVSQVIRGVAASNNDPVINNYQKQQQQARPKTESQSTGTQATPNKTDKTNAEDDSKIKFVTETNGLNLTLERLGASNATTSDVVKPDSVVTPKYKFDQDYNNKLRPVLNNWLQIVSQNPNEAKTAALYIQFVENNLAKIKAAIEKAALE